MPLLLRVASLLGLRLPLASLLLFIQLFASILSTLSKDSIRVLMIALSLGMLGWACSFAVNTYSARFRQPDGEPFPSGSSQSQVRVIVLVTALPLCALALALVAPLIPLPLAFVFWVVTVVSLLGAVVLLMVTIWVGVSASALD